ncbi:hypothetical protein Tco_1464894 [Tanacetum coccineum]
MTTPVEKRNASKFCKFHREVEHTTDECMHLKWQIKEMLKAGKLSHLIKELKQNNGKDQAKVAKKGETRRKGQRHTTKFLRLRGTDVAKKGSPNTHSLRLSLISFPTLGDEVERKGPMIIKAESRMTPLYTACGTVTLRSSRIIPLECAMISGPRTQQPVVDQVTEKIQVEIHP